MRSIVFLDIDGVLNTSEHYAKWHAAMAQLYGDDQPRPSIPIFGDPDALNLLFGESQVAQLNWLTEQSGAAIVVSSSWRLFFTGPAPSRPLFSDLVRVLRRAGVTADVIGATPPRVHDRGPAIQAWLEREGRWAEFMTPPTGSPPRIAILDDFPPDNFPPEVRHLVVQTDPDVGLTAAEAESALELIRS